MQKSVSDQIFAALTSSQEPVKQIEALEAVVGRYAMQSFSTGSGACQMREFDDATSVQSGSKSDE